MGITTKILDKGRIVQKKLLSVLNDHEERLKALEGTSETSKTEEPKDDENSTGD